MRQGRSLQEFAAELDRQNSAKADYVADTRRMHFTTHPGDGTPGSHSELDLVGEGATSDTDSLIVTEICHRQISGYLDIPWKFYTRIQAQVPDLFDTNVNRLLRHNPERRMVRTLDGKARAFLSDRYRRLDNYELAQVVLPILRDLGEGVRVESCELTDSRMYIKAITPRVTGQVKVGEEVCAGVFISNSEVGWGKLRVEPFVYTLACTNGMVLPRELGNSLSRIHVGRRVQSDEESYRVFRDETLQADDRAFFMAVADVVRAAVDEVRFRDVIESLRASAAGQALQSVTAGVERLAKAEGLNDGEKESVLTHLAAGGDLSRWGLLSAVTRASQDVDSYDRATEMEEMGGKILGYTEREWAALAAPVS
jgi:hypothetical protein